MKRNYGNFEEMEFRTLIDRVFNRDKKSAFAGTYTDATGNDPQGRNRTPGGSARQGNTPNGSGQLSLSANQLRTVNHPLPRLLLKAISLQNLPTEGRKVRNIRI